MPYSKSQRQSGGTGKARGQYRRRKRLGQGQSSRESSSVINCLCPNCGTVVPKQPAIPCRQISCPTCGTLMMRERK
ncbi:MAG: hypothetical protein N2246_01010 [Candidatus Sumerlaeia bacterium]|nr:hypothetical protein [Candidatus Sumerlaeia bacterium]